MCIRDSRSTHEHDPEGLTLARGSDAPAGFAQACRRAIVPAMELVSGAPILVLGHGASGSAATMAPYVAVLRARGIDARAIDLPKGRAERAVPRFAALLAGGLAVDGPE